MSAPKARPVIKLVMADVDGTLVTTQKILTEQARQAAFKLRDAGIRLTLETLFRDYGKPLYLRSDNGSEFVAACWQGWLRKQGTLPLFIDPGSPWQNGKCESFNGRFRDECLNAEWWASLREAQNVMELWREHYPGLFERSELQA